MKIYRKEVVRARLVCMCYVYVCVCVCVCVNSKRVCIFRFVLIYIFITKQIIYNNNILKPFHLCLSFSLYQINIVSHNTPSLIAVHLHQLDSDEVFSIFFIFSRDFRNHLFLRDGRLRDQLVLRKLLLRLCWILCFRRPRFRSRLFRSGAGRLRFRDFRVLTLRGAFLLLRSRGRLLRLLRDDLQRDFFHGHPLLLLLWIIGPLERHFEFIDGFPFSCFVSFRFVSREKKKKERKKEEIRVKVTKIVYETKTRTRDDQKRAYLVFPSSKSNPSLKFSMFFNAHACLSAPFASATEDETLLSLLFTRA
jgi:hypothetical protein